VLDTVINGKNFLIRTRDSIPALHEEQYALYSANRGRIEYIFHKNKDRSSTTYHSWANAAQTYYKALYTVDKKADKKVGSLLGKLKIKGMSEEEKIKTIEKYIKTEYEIKSVEGIEGGEEILNITENMYSSEMGITRLFVAMFEIAGIEHQLGITNDKTEHRFDKDFMTWNYLNDFVFWFPAGDKYMSPVSFEYRYGTVPVINSSVYGMFLKRVQIGDMTTAVPVFRYIPSPSCKESFTNLEVDVTFPGDIDCALVDLKHLYGGEAGIPIKPYFEFLPEQDRDALLEQLVKSIGEDVEIIEKAVFNTSLDASPFEEPLTVRAKVKYQSAVERAGENYIFNIGKLIGGQVEMYQDHSRQQPIDIDFMHELDRVISFTVPDGYNVKGLEDLKINIEYSTDGKKSMGFISDYEVKGDIVKVHVYEYYALIEYPIEQYEEFREVINAAADFNKISLLFEKD